MKKRQFKKEIKKLQKKACYGLDSIKSGDIVYGDGTIYKINSGVYLKSSAYSEIFCMKADVYFYDGTFKSIIEDIYLSDMNVINGGYNIYRVFHSKKDAIKYDALIKKTIKIEKNFRGQFQTVYTLVNPSKGPIVEETEKFMKQQKIGKLTLTYKTSY